ncbi:hypothetical protein, partial [Paenibacillus sp. CR_12]|uniref:hypothetical protein n=1 Tax=Paenibacillus sp. CR_12 TaxID=3055793 RepID=UPI0035C1A58F
PPKWFVLLTRCSVFKDQLLRLSPTSYLVSNSYILSHPLDHCKLFFEFIFQIHFSLLIQAFVPGRISWPEI